MRNRFFIALTLFLTFITTLSATAQSGNITVKLLDADIPTLPVAGAVAEVTPTTDVAAKLYYSSDGSGVLTVPNLRYGKYTIVISFFGYESETLNVDMNQPLIALPDIAMKASSVQMEAVVKEIKALRASQSGDTLNYNASAYKVTDDADVEGLLQKMPGISIEEGEVTAQGETIKKIYVDGREFFGNDVATALKSLPAEVVDRIEVYDKLSDDAAASGMDDGQGQKTINIITKPSMRQGLFGKMFGGGGYEPKPNHEDVDKVKYMGGGSVNLFYDTSRISVITMVNNLNQQNFSFEDIMGVTDDNASSNSGSFMVKPLPGVAEVFATGVNYSDVFGENDKLKVQGSYFFNKTATTDEEGWRRWYNDPIDGSEKSLDSLIQTTNKYTTNSNHRLNGRIDWRIDDRQSLSIRPTLSLQDNNPININDGYRYGSQYAGEGWQKFDDIYNGDWKGYNVGVSGNYSLRLGGDDSRRKVISVGGSYYTNNYDSDVTTDKYDNYLSTTEPVDPEDRNITRRAEYNPTTRSNVGASLGYTQPLSDYLTLNTTYKYTSNIQELDKRGYALDADGNIDTETEDTDTINSTSSTFARHMFGPGVRYKKGKSNLVANVYYQYSMLDSESITKKQNSDVVSLPPSSNNFKDITYSMVGQLYFNAENSLRIKLNSDTNNPSVWRLKDAVTTTSDEYVSRGNSSLLPSYSHRLLLRYIHSNLKRGSTLMYSLSATMMKDYLATHIVLNPGEVTIDGKTYEEMLQYTTWSNVDGYYNFYTRLNYGTPLDFIKCNINFNMGFGYSIIPNIYGGDIDENGLIHNGTEGSTDKMSYTFRTVLGSNISENVDFTLSWGINYSEATNTTTSNSAFVEEKNKYYDQTAQFVTKFVFLKGFTFTGSVMYRQYRGLTDNYNDQYTLCNAFIGHKVFKNKRGELTVGVNDIFNQNMSIARTVGSNFSQNITHLTLGRYYSAQFIYNLRYFGRNGSKDIKDYKGMKRLTK